MGVRCTNMEVCVWDESQTRTDNGNPLLSASQPASQVRPFGLTSRVSAANELGRVGCLCVLVGLELDSHSDSAQSGVGILTRTDR